MPDTDIITCIAVLGTTPTGEQLYLEIASGFESKRRILQVKPNGHRIKKPKDDNPCYWYTENIRTGFLFTADTTEITADNTNYTADDEGTSGDSFLTLHPSLYDLEINQGFHTREYWTTKYQRLEFFGSVDEVQRQMELMFNLINNL